MAKRLSTAEALRIDRGALDKLNRAELAKVVQTLSDTANKRLQRLERLNAKVPSYVSATRKNERFTTRGKNLNELREEYARASRFLKGKSTVAGAKDTKSKTEKLIKKGKLSFSQLSDFWERYDKLKEHNPGLSYTGSIFSEKFVKWISDELKLNADDVDFEELIQKADKLYEQGAGGFEEFEDEEAFEGYYEL